MRNRFRNKLAPTALIASLLLLAGCRQQLRRVMAPVLDRMAVPDAQVVADLLREFPSAKTNNTMAVQVQEAELLGERASPVLYLHPTASGDATVTYKLRLPRLPRGYSLLLTGMTATDPYVWKKTDAYRHNGVKYIIRINGETVLERIDPPSEGIPFVVILDRFSEDDAELQLATNAVEGNENYDWAHFVAPKILLMRRIPADSQGALPGMSGMIFCQTAALPEKGGSVEIQGFGPEGQPVGEVATLPLRPAPGCQWTFGEYDLAKTPGAAQVRVVGAQGFAANRLIFANYLPQLRIGELSLGLATLQPRSEAPVRAVLSNDGLGTWEPGQAEMIFAIGGAETTTGELNPLGPGEKCTVSGIVRSGEAGRTALVAAVRDGAQLLVMKEFPTFVDNLPPILFEPRKPGLSATSDKELSVIQNDLCRMVVATLPGQRWTAFYQVADGERWITVAIAPMPTDVSLKRKDEPVLCPLVSVEMATEKTEQTARLLLKMDFDSPLKKSLRAEADYILGAGKPMLDIEYRLFAPQGTSVSRFAGPSLRVNDGFGGWRKRGALFPGLEYLGPDEHSSGTRDAKPPVSNRLAPDRLKVTMPLMAVCSDSALVALLWDGAQRWDGANQGLGAAFASPNFVEQADNHLMELFLPPPVEFRPENDRLAGAGCPMDKDGRWTLRAKLLLDKPKDCLSAVDAWLDEFHMPLPSDRPWPVQKTYDIAREGLMKTVWDGQTQKSRHCIDWAPANAPQLGLLLWMDSKLAADPLARQTSRRRADLIFNNTLRDEGPGGLQSPACCHIMWGSAAFYTGHLRAARTALVAQADALLGSQRADGAWSFSPDEQRKALGDPDYASQGIVSRNAYSLWRIARLTGYEPAIEGGRRALAYHERFSIPHGAQGWECPIYQPDVLGSAYGLAAFLEAYEAVGDPAYLEKAVYWARTGICFHYMWQDGNVPPWMLYAGIPVFGTTFFTHSWMGVPVQWCSLVYAYWLQRLSQYDHSYPWTQLAEGITISGERQLLDFDDARKRTGTYPDSLGRRMTVHNGPFINPEDILLNRMSLEGSDTEVRTIVLRTDKGRVHVTSCARVQNAKLEDHTLIVELAFWPGEASGTMIAGISRPSKVMFGGRPLPERDDLPSALDGWEYSETARTLYVRCRHREGAPARLEIVFGGG
ncbi:MAG TPA: hypothetical protein PL033_05175 [Candidatus Brocadiia bacterium]|nr:hypothetical protein [Candidatus Brocadiia bacterium]